MNKGADITSIFKQTQQTSPQTDLTEHVMMVGRIQAGERGT